MCPQRYYIQVSNVSPIPDILELVYSLQFVLFGGHPQQCSGSTLSFLPSVAASNVWGTMRTGDQS